MRSSLPFVLLLFAQLFCSSLFAQWQNVGSNITAVPRNIYGLSVPNSSVVWGITIHPNYTAAAREFTRSTNGGISWQTGVIDAANGQDFTALSVFALDANTAWVTMTDNGTQRLGRIYKTSNGGLSWEEQKGSFNNLNNAVVAVHFFDENNGFAYGSPGTGDALADSLRIWRTSNGGNNWGRIPAGQLPTPLAEEGIWIYYGNGSYDVAGDSIWFGTRRGRVWRSTDRGNSWQAFSIGADVPVYSVAFSDAKNGLVTSDGRGFRTFDGGATWSEITMPNSFVYYQIENVPGTPGAYVLIYEGSDMFYTDFRMAYTLNDGDDWQSLPPKDIECVQFLSATQGFGGGRVFSATTGGIYRWTGNLNALTSLKETSFAQNSIRAYPNPFSDFTLVEFELDRVTPVDYSITDLTGQLIEKGNIEKLTVGKNQLRISPKAPAGVYLLTLKQQQRIQTLKLIKR